VIDGTAPPDAETSSILDSHLYWVIEGPVRILLIQANGVTGSGKTFTVQHVVRRVLRHLEEERDRLISSGQHASVYTYCLEFRATVKRKTHGEYTCGKMQCYRLDADTKAERDKVLEPMLTRPPSFGSTVSVTPREMGTAQGAYEAYMALPRITLATKGNPTSSRSHAAICATLTVGEGKARREVASVMLVDMAGSEPFDYDADPKLRAQGKAINSDQTAFKSHMTDLLRENKAGRNALRGSELLKVISPYFSGDPRHPEARVVLIGCVYGHPDQYNNAKNTLEFISRSRGINPQTVSKATAITQRISRDAHRPYYGSPTLNKLRAKMAQRTERATRRLQQAEREGEREMELEEFDTETDTISISVDREALQNIEREITELAVQVQILSQTRTEMQSESADKDSRIVDLKAQLEEQRQSIEEYRDKEDRDRQALDAANTLALEARAEAAKWRERLDTTRDKLDRATDRAMEAEDRAAEYTATISCLQQSLREAERERERERETALREAERERETAVRETERERETALREAERERETAVQLREEMEARLQEHKARIEHLQSQQTSSDTAMAEAREAAQARALEYAETIAVAETQADHARVRYAELEAVLRGEREQLAEVRAAAEARAEADARALAEAKCAAETQAEDASVRYAELEAVLTEEREQRERERDSVLTGERELLAEVRTAAETQAEQASERYSQLEALLAEATAAAERQEEQASARYAELEAVLAEKREQLQRSETAREREREQLQVVRSEKSQLESQCKELGVLVDSLRSEAEREREIQQMEEENTGLKQQLAESQSLLAELQSSLTLSKEVALAESRSKVSQLQASITLSKEAADQALAEAEAMVERERSQAQAMVESATKSHTSTTALLEERYQRELEVAIEARDEKIAVQMQLEAQVAALEEANATLRTSLSEVREEMERERDERETERAEREREGSVLHRVLQLQEETASEMSTLQTHLSDANEERDNALASAFVLQDRLDSAAADVVRVRDTLESEAAEREREWILERDELELRLVQQTSLVSTLQTEREKEVAISAERVREAQRLETEREALSETVVAELEKEREKTQVLKTKLSERDSQLERVRERLGERATEAEESNSLVELLQREVAALTRERDKLRYGAAVTDAAEVERERETVTAEAAPATPDPWCGVGVTPEVRGRDTTLSTSLGSASPLVPSLEDPQAGVTGAEEVLATESDTGVDGDCSQEGEGEDGIESAEVGTVLEPLHIEREREGEGEGEGDQTDTDTTSASTAETEDAVESERASMVTDASGGEREWVDWEPLDSQFWDTPRNPKQNTYQGEYNLYGQRSGKGNMVYKNGDRYSGSWRFNKRHGKGRMVYASGETYSGDWKGSRRIGHGINIYPKGAMYDGDFFGDAPDGHGTIHYPDGSTYKGEWTRGVRSGHGVWADSQGNEYDGEWVGGMKHGRGQYTDAKGDIYVGDWVKDQMHRNQTCARKRRGVWGEEIEVVEEQSWENGVLRFSRTVGNKILQRTGSESESGGEPPGHRGKPRLLDGLVAAGEERHERDHAETERVRERERRTQLPKGPRPKAVEKGVMSYTEKVRGGGARKRPQK
ncbi:hypothetical protein KIPB_003380, partial [Kipferlia bialata]